LITGGSRGIGAAIAHELARRGADVAINYFNDYVSADKVAGACRALGRKAIAIKAHIGDPASRKELWAAFDQTFPRLDFLVANAATGVHKPVLDVSLSSLRKVFQVNFESLLDLAAEAVPRMGEGPPPGPGLRGRIVALSSIGAERVLRNYGTVGTSKAALEALCRQLAVELGPSGINVNVVRAGLCDTGVLHYLSDREAIIAETVARTPNRRLVSPEDVAKLVAFALSEDGSMLNGQILNVDGGFSATCS
jgi:enoyl-[acyl-carrier protein] reductase III